MINFRELYESYANEVFHFSLWLSGNSSDADYIRHCLGRSSIYTCIRSTYVLFSSRIRKTDIRINISASHSLR